ncbi:hypothetical protein JL722_2131 [Aureococcus anophagefferens]|nr:hypothetical protein JL722_2131 [Aureococcus anophagefferens]
MANATVCLHYKEGDVSASFKLVLSPALQAKHATGKLLAWFARAERGTRPWRTDRLILVDLDGRCLDLDAPLAATLAAQAAGDDGFARLLVRPWLHERTAAALVAPKTADAWALFCPIEKLVLYDKSAATPADAPGLSADDVFYLRFLRKLRGSGAGLGKERQESFKKLMEGEAQRGDWKKEKRWARRGQIPRPGCRWVTSSATPCLVAEILGKEPVEDPSGAAPAGLRGGERVVARRYGVSKEHVEYDDGDDVVCGWAPAVAFFDAEEPPELKRELGDASSSDDDDDDGVLPRPPGIAPKLWGRVLAAHEWKGDGDRLLALRGLRARDAAAAYDVAVDFANLADADACAGGDAACGAPWATRRLAPLLRAFWRAAALNAAVALLASGEAQAAIDALARDRPSPGLLRAEPDDADGLFCRAEALARLRFPKLALDQLDLVKATHGASLTERQARTLDAARDHAAEKIAALAKPKRKTKKRW